MGLAGLVAALSLPISARSQDCAQPNSGGCPLAVGQVVTGAIVTPDATDLWRVRLAEAGALRASLDTGGADLRLYIYGPDLALVRVSDTGGRATEIVEIPQAEVGEYQIFVDSPR